MSIVIGLLILGLLIFVHELGHFLVAKLCKVEVLEFSIGFGKKIASFKRGFTRYSIGVFPLGGYVRMLGDDPRLLNDKYKDLTLQEIQAKSDDAEGPPLFLMQDIEDRSADELTHLNDRGKWFLYKNYFQKFAVVFAGPLFNVLFAWLVAVFIVFNQGIPELVNKPIIGGVAEDSPAMKANIKSDVTVLSINSISFETWEELAEYVQNSKGEKLELEFKSEDGTVETVEVYPEKISSEIAAVYGLSEDLYRIGIEPSYSFKPVSFLSSFYYGFNYVANVSYLTVNGIVAMFKGKVSSEHIGGPISIIGYAAKSAEMGFQVILKFIIMLSISLALLNLLPIPVLDGGHILIFTIEALTRRKLGIRAYERMTQVGMFIILSLFVFATGNDLSKLFSKFF